jgi:hypothetical protein
MTTCLNFLVSSGMPESLAAGCEPAKTEHCDQPSCFRANRKTPENIVEPTAERPSTLNECHSPLK